MSLRKAVEEIVGEMEKDLKGVPSSVSDKYRTVWRMLKMALKASEGEAVQQPAPMVNPMAYMNDNTIHRVMIEKAKGEFTGKVLKVEEEESSVPLMIHGGPNDGDMHLVPHHMPIGAKTSINSRVYVRKPDGLHICDGVEVGNS